MNESARRRRRPFLILRALRFKPVSRPRLPRRRSLEILNSFARPYRGKGRTSGRNKGNVLYLRDSRAETAEAFNERQESEAGGNRENNKKWTGRKEPAGDGGRAGNRGQRGTRERKERKRGERAAETFLVPRKLPAGEYTVATDSFRGTSRGLYVLMYSLIGLPLFAGLSLQPPRLLIPRDPHSADYTS